jgi:hypothetical protein
MASMWDQLPGYGAEAKRDRPTVPGDQELPKAIRMLWAITYEHDPSPSAAIADLITRIRQWMLTDGGRSRMNRTFASWRSHNPAKLAAMANYLEGPSMESLFRQQGASWALNKLRRGFALVAEGDRADVAFGTQDPLPPTTSKPSN